jgi:hypothetical protein
VPEDNSVRAHGVSYVGRPQDDDAAFPELFNENRIAPVTDLLLETPGARVSACHGGT